MLKKDWIKILADLNYLYQTQWSCFQVLSDKKFLRQGNTVGHFKLDIGTVFDSLGTNWGFCV